MASGRQAWPSGPEGGRVFGLEQDLIFATLKLVFYQTYSVG